MRTIKDVALFEVYSDMMYMNLDVDCSTCHGSIWCVYLRWLVLEGRKQGDSKMRVMCTDVTLLLECDRPKQQ